MNTLLQRRKYALALGLVSAFLVTNGLLDSPLIPPGAIVSSAEARVGHPLTPGSVAGVARRTTRRTIRRSTVYIARLPAHCTRVNINGVMLSHCGGVYYQPYQGRYVMVHVN
jgi:hypothetical protein